MGFYAHASAHNDFHPVHHLGYGFRLDQFPWWQAMTTSAPRRTGKSLLGNAKVTEAQVRAVRSMYELAGWKPEQLMERFSLDKGAIERITSGKTGANIFVSVKDLPEGIEPLAQFRGRK